MPDRIHRTPLTRLPHARLLALVALLSGLLIGGCGGSSGNPAATAGGASTTAGGATTSATTAGGTGATTTSASTGAGAGTRTTTRSATATGGGASRARSIEPGSSRAEALLAFARCMRANGVTDFPDPNPARPALFAVPTGSNPAAPAFRVALPKCEKLLPGGGPPGPGSATHPSAQTLAKLLRIARCMRGHGVPQFPDPRASVPSNPSGFQEITDFDGAILLFPSTINLQAPAYREALTACGAPPLGLPH